MDRHRVQLLALASREAEILVPSAQGARCQWCHTFALLSPYRGGVAAHVGCMGLHYAGDDSSVDAVPEAYRFASYLLILLWTHSDVLVYSFGKIAQGA